MDSKKVLVIGSTGLVGSNFLESALFNGFEVTGMARVFPKYARKSGFVSGDCFDQQVNWESILLGFNSVIFLAFPTSIDEVEKYSDQQKNRLLNGFKRFVEAAEKIIPRVAFFSSDAVLWGTTMKERVPECLPNPINVYGRLKAKCEEILIKSRIKHTVAIRCTPVGLHPFLKSHGFVGKMLDSGRLSSAGGFDNVFFTPVSVNACTVALQAWCKSDLDDLKELPQIIHFGSDNKISKFDFLKLLFNRLTIDSRLRRVQAEFSGANPIRVFDQSFIASECSIFYKIPLSQVINDCCNQIDRLPKLV